MGRRERGTGGERGLHGLPQTEWASLPASKIGDVLSGEETFTHIYAVLPGKGGMSYERKQSR